MKHRLIFFTLIALLALAAAWATLEITEPPGPVLDPDAMAYLGAGISLANGHGLRIPSALWFSADTTAPLTHFPPGFSTTIAAGITAGLTPVNAARFIEAAAAATTVAFIAFLLFEAGTTTGALTAIVLLAVTPAMLIAHAAVLSEPLFLALLVCFIWQLSRTGERSRSWRRTLALGALAAAATLVRYAGASLVAAVVIDAWLDDDHGILDKLPARIRRAATAALLPVLTLGAWTFSRPPAQSGDRIRRIALYSGGLADTFVEGAETLGRWLAPNVDSLAITAGLAVLMAGAVVTLFVQAANTRSTTPPEAPRWYRTRLLRALTITAGCYALILVASRLFADGAIPFDDRMLAPLLLLVTVAIAFSLGTLWQSAAWRASHRVMLAGTIAVVAIWMYGAATVSAVWALDYQTDGGDLAGREWRTSPLAEWATHDGAHAPLYSNWPAAIWFHTGRAVHELPTELDPATVTRFREKIAREHGALISYATPSADIVPPDSLAKMAGLVPVASWPQGTVWRAASDSARIHP